MAQPVVLVVEDERPIALLLAKLVEGCGAEAVVAHNGGEAVRLMLERRPDLVLLDLIMPIMSGEDVLQDMQDSERLADVPVVIISTKEMMPETLPSHIRYLQKPFVPADVRQLVRELLHLPPPGA